MNTGEETELPHVTFVHPDGHEQDVEATLGQSVMQVATANLVAGIIGECGGELICATCHVFVEEKWLDLLPPMSQIEEEMLDVASEEPTRESRLSCQIVITEETSGVRVRIPATQR